MKSNIYSNRNVLRVDGLSNKFEGPKPRHFLVMMPTNFPNLVTMTSLGPIWRKMLWILVSRGDEDLEQSQGHATVQMYQEKYIVSQSIVNIICGHQSQDWPWFCKNQRCTQPIHTKAMSLWCRGVGHHKEHGGIHQCRSIYASSGGSERDCRITATSLCDVSDASSG